MSSLVGPGSAVRRIVITAVVLVCFLGLSTYALGDGAYLWIKSAHVVAVISWMAGLLYLPRLFIYHCDAPVGTPQSETFKVMEQRLLAVIMLPALVAVWVLGLWLAWRGGFGADRWMIAKIFLVIGLSGVHGYFYTTAHRFAADQNLKSARHWRLMNEVPTVLMIAIVVLVVVKPF
jgi:protoporphyrinogen IX oxidase